MPSSPPRYLGVLFARPDASQVAWPPPLPASVPGWAPRRMQEASRGGGLSTGSRETHWGGGDNRRQPGPPIPRQREGHHRRRPRPWLVRTDEPGR